MRDIVAELKALRLHGMARCYAEQSAHGGASIQIAAELFGGLLDAEVADRRVRSIRYQMSAARFPHHRDLAGFDFSVAHVDESLIHAFRRCLHANDNLARLVQVFLGEPLDLPANRGREEQRLPVLGQRGKDPTQVREKTHIKHAIGLIENDIENA